jgi:hypothetical protein
MPGHHEIIGCQFAIGVGVDLLTGFIRKLGQRFMAAEEIAGNLARPYSTETAKASGG